MSCYCFWIFVVAAASVIQQAAATCSSIGISTASVKESAAVGSTIKTLDASYSSNAVARKAEYSCYFRVANNSLQLARELNLENLTSCINGSIIPAALVDTAVTIEVPCASGTETSIQVVSLDDVNEFAPQFKPSSFTVRVSEATAVGTMIIQLNRNVTDADKSNQNTFNFFIVAGSSGHFSMIDGITSGIIRLQRPLDFDAGQRRFVMNVSAVELATNEASSPRPLTGYATLEILVTDADDLNPAFTQPSYSLSLPENNTSILNQWQTTQPPLLAQDSDVGINQSVVYSFGFGAWSSSIDKLLANFTFLAINSSSGQIALTQIVDREALPSNQLLMQVKAAQENLLETRVAWATVSLNFTDKNDNAPVMSAALYNAAILENSPAGTVVAMVAATDADFGSNAQFEFKILDDSGALRIDSATGAVTVRNATVIDRELFKSINASVWAQESSSAERLRSAASQLIVQLLDANDNTPQAPVSLSFSISRAASIGTLIGNISASDADEGAAGTVRFSLIFGSDSAINLFEISSASGSVITKSSLASAAASTYFLAVAVDDTGANVRRAVTVVQINLFPNLIRSTVTTIGGGSSSTTQSTAAQLASSQSAPAWLLIVCALMAAATVALCITVAVLMRTRCKENDESSPINGVAKRGKGGGGEAGLEESIEPQLNGKSNPIYAHADAAEQQSPIADSHLQPSAAASAAAAATPAAAQEANIRAIAAERPVKLQELKIFPSSSDIVV